MNFHCDECGKGAHGGHSYKCSKHPAYQDDDTHRAPERSETPATGRDYDCYNCGGKESAHHEGCPALEYAAPELDVEAERQTFANVIDPVELVRHFTTIGPIEAAFKVWLAARTAATSTAPAKLDTKAERQEFADTVDPQELVREFLTIGPIEAAFHIWLAARVGSFLKSGAATSTQAARELGEFQLVPRVMTEDMHIAFAEVWFSKVRPIDDHDMQDAYAAMLEAAPSPHSPVGAKEQDK